MSIAVKQTGDLSDLARRLGASSEAVDKAMLSAGNQIARELRRKIADNIYKRKRSGILSASWQAGQATISGGRMTVSVFSDLVYARIQELGGTIYPKNGPFLVFPVPGSEGYTPAGVNRGLRSGVPLIFARKVTIPARPYVKPAVEEIKPRAIDIFRERLAGVVRGTGGDGGNA